MNKPAEENSQKAMSTPHTDDESITTSTESDSLETWTLVNDKKKKSKADINSVTANRSTTNNIIENLANIDDSLSDANKDIHESADSRTDDDSNVDDISEGISIISESESVGRASPPAISANFNNIDLKSFSNMDDISPASMLRLPIHIPQSSYSMSPTVGPFEEKALRQRRFKRSSSNENNEKIALNNTKNESIVKTGMVYPLVRQGLKGLFFICATLSILAFVGKLRNPDWQPFCNINNLSVLEQKLTDLELQNNLMRAEIDILSKQVNYLSSLSESGRINSGKIEREHKPQQRNFKQTGEWIMKQKEKNFKAGPDIGDNLDPIELTKDEIKNSFKCPDGKFVEIADMCVEKTEPKIKKMNNYIKVIEDIVVDQIVEGVHSFKSEPNTDSASKAYVNKFQKNTNKVDSNKSEAEYKNNNKHMNDGNINSKERKFYRTSKDKYEKQKLWQQKHKHQNQDNYNKNDDDDFSEEDEDFDDSFEGFDKSKFTSKEDYKNEQKHFNDDKYKRRHQSDKFNGRSTERRFNGNSKETRYGGSAEQSLKSSDWHEKLMQQRENARRHNDFRERNKNWFIERGDSREKMRHR